MIFYTIRALSNLFPRAMTLSFPVDCSFTQLLRLVLSNLYLLLHLSYFLSYNWNPPHRKSLPCCLHKILTSCLFSKFLKSCQAYFLVFHNNFINISGMYLRFIALCSSVFPPGLFTSQHLCNSVLLIISYHAKKWEIKSPQMLHKTSYRSYQNFLPIMILLMSLIFTKTICSFISCMKIITTWLRYW